MFLEPDEHIIIMEDDYSKFYTLEEIRQLMDAGIKTVYLPRSMWYKNGVLDLDHYKNRTEKYNEVGIKMLIAFYYGTTNKSVLESYQEIEHLRNERTQFIFAIPDGGEFLWDTALDMHQPRSTEEAIEFIVNAERILIDQFGEVWINLHNFMGYWNSHNIELVYETLRNEFLGFPVYSFQFAHLEIGHQRTSDDCQSVVRIYHDKYDIGFFIGSQYCEGLITNLDVAIDLKVRGFVTSPLHSENLVKHDKIEPWMLDAIREANQKFNEA